MGEVFGRGGSNWLKEERATSIPRDLSFVHSHLTL